jgi:hypothetical protein
MPLVTSICKEGGVATTDEVSNALGNATDALAALIAEHSGLSMYVNWWRRHYARVGHKQLGRLFVRGVPSLYSLSVTDGSVGSTVQQAADELTALWLDNHTAGEQLGEWLRLYYSSIGYRKLGRLLIRRAPPGSRSGSANATGDDSDQVNRHRPVSGAADSGVPLSPAERMRYTRTSNLLWRLGVRTMQELEQLDQLQFRDGIGQSTIRLISEAIKLGDSERLRLLLEGPPPTNASSRPQRLSGRQQAQFSSLHGSLRSRNRGQIDRIADAGTLPMAGSLERLDECQRRARPERWEISLSNPSANQHWLQLSVVGVLASDRDTAGGIVDFINAARVEMPRLAAEVRRLRRQLGR